MHNNEELTTSALRIAFPPTDKTKSSSSLLTLIEIEEALAAVADVSQSQFSRQAQLALLEALEHSPKEILELGCADGFSVISFFFLTQAERVRGIELCAARFASSREALKRLALGLRCCAIVADGSGLIRLEFTQFKHQSKRILELRRGDFLEMPLPAFRQADLVILDATIPQARDHQLRILFQAVAVGTTIATRYPNPLERTSPHLTLRAKLRVPWTLALYDHSLPLNNTFAADDDCKPKSFFSTNIEHSSPRGKEKKQKQFAQIRGGRCAQFTIGDRVLVTAKNGPARRARILAHLRSPYLSVLYEFDGHIEDRVHITRISTIMRKSSAADTQERRQLADCYNHLPREEKRKTAGAQWVSVWDETNSNFFTTPPPSSQQQNACTPLQTTTIFHDENDIVLLPPSPPSHRRHHYDNHILR